MRRVILCKISKKIDNSYSFFLQYLKMFRVYFYVYVKKIFFLFQILHFKHFFMKKNIAEFCMDIPVFRPFLEEKKLF